MSLWRYLGMRQVRVDLGNCNLDETHRSDETTKLAVEHVIHECSYNILKTMYVTELNWLLKMTLT